MKYSIVIPTLTQTKEHWDVLNACLDSIHENSEDYELILVDDGSTYVDPSYDEDAWKNFLTFDTLIQYEKNKGIACSWNDGIKVARGEYIAVVNDDITVQKGWLDKLRQALEMEDEYLVSAPGVAGKSEGIGIEEDYQWFPGYCFMLDRTIIRRIGYFDEQFSPFNFEDTDYWTRVLQTKGKLVRNYSTTITHKEGDVLHTLDYDAISEQNKKKFVAKHGFDPIPVFYEGKKFDFTNP